MILVIGTVVVRDGAMVEATALSRVHVERSRTESGCVSHDVHVDTENPNRLVFVERWQDYDALETHFSVPESNEFVRDLRALSDELSPIEIYDAELR